MVGLVAAALMAAIARTMPRSSHAGLLVFLPLAAFWYGQCMNSHAATDADFTFFMLAYAVHLAFINVWGGAVLVAGFVVLVGRAKLDSVARAERAAYVHLLSDSATVSLSSIFATGSYLTWHIVGTFDALVQDAYGKGLLAKLALVGIAAAMGGYNRFFVMPALEDGKNASEDAAAVSMRFRRILRFEALVQLAVLVLAAIISSSAPPGAAL